MKCHVTVMKLLLKMNHLAALQGQVSPHHSLQVPYHQHQNGQTIISGQIQNITWTNFTFKKNRYIYFFYHLKAQNVTLNFILYSNFTIFLLKNLTSYIQINVYFSLFIFGRLQKKSALDCRLSEEKDFRGNKSHDSLWQAITKELNGEWM